MQAPLSSKSATERGTLVALAISLHPSPLRRHGSLIPSAASSSALKGSGHRPEPALGIQSSPYITRLISYLNDTRKGALLMGRNHGSSSRVEAHRPKAADHSPSRGPPDKWALAGTSPGLDLPWLLQLGRQHSWRDEQAVGIRLSGSGHPCDREWGRCGGWDCSGSGRSSKAKCLEPHFWPSWKTVHFSAWPPRRHRL